MLSKEDMALEALIKIVSELMGTITSYHVTDSTLDYANEALKANGWEVYLDEFTRSHIRKIDAQAPNTPSN